MPRFDISLKCDSEKTPINQRFPFIYGPRLSVEDVIKYILPWAEFRVDDDDKYDYLESIWSAECYCGYDKEDNTIYYTQRCLTTPTFILSGIWWFWKSWWSAPPAAY